MQSIFELKEQAVTETPLLLFDCVLADGRTEHWSTHKAQAGGVDYEPRVIRHNAFEIQAAQDQGVDGIPRVSLSMANADSKFSQLERSVGFKGAKLTVRFLFYDLAAGEPASDAVVVFLGTCNPPEEITESVFRLSATNRMSMQRVLLPQVRIQRRCPWTFPETATQRAEAAEGGSEGKYSRFYRCGYSADVEGGSGRFDGSAPFTSCGYTRADCETRGMATHFGGIEYVPSTIQVRSFGEKATHLSAVAPNEARYNDFVPMVYGTAWVTPPVVFARNDGNLTHMEVLLGIGEIEGVVKVLVNEVEIPLGHKGTNMTGTGWYNVPTLGTRAGGFNLDFVNGDGSPAGDPYGSMAYLSLVVPNRVNDGRSLPTVKVLLQGLRLPVYGEDGEYGGESWSSNPAWILLDVLRRSGWATSEIDLASFARAAAYCDERITALDLNGNAMQIPRFACNAAVQKRRSAGDVIRGIRNAARLYLTYGAGGRVELRVENTMALQQGSKPAGSNSVEPLNGGWPSYEFGDGTMGRSGILRGANGEPSIRLWSRSCSDSANRFTVEFQDALNEYQQDGMSLVDGEDVARSGQEITGPLGVLGIPNFDQAGRILRYHLEKSLRGNLYVDFTTSVKGLCLRPGELIAVTYGKEGLERQPFRVLRVAPGANYGVVSITAQVHDDGWYGDTNGQGAGAPARREVGAGMGLPRPVSGTWVDEHGEVQLGIVEQESGNEAVQIEVSFTPPGRPDDGSPGVPLLSLAAAIGTNGTLGGGRSVYYAVSGVSADGAEGPLSFLVRATLPEGSGHSVTLKGLSFPTGTAAFHVYRGESPVQLYRIASDEAIAGQFTDAGSPKLLIPPPDANFDHANFYWRRELQPESAATVASSNTAGNGSLEMVEDRYRGAVARITRGPGAGQERLVMSNTATTVTVAPAWDIPLDAGSFFVVAEGGWRFGAVSRTSPVRFEVPNRAGETVEVCGRAANANDVECAGELSTVSRWQLGGSAGGDSGVPCAPVFGFSESTRGGTIEVRAVGFPNPENTHGITCGTLTLYWWNELKGASNIGLAAAVGEDDAVVRLSGACEAVAGSMIQIEGEVMRVEEEPGSGAEYAVTRGAHGTNAAPHAEGAAVYLLSSSTAVMPFPEGFFGSPYSGSWAYPVFLPDARLVSAELFVTNQFGNSPAGSMNFAQQQHYGLRTLSGGQYSIQVDGFLAVEECAAPVLIVETAHAVRDVFAVLGRAADAEIQLRIDVNGAPYCFVSVPAGWTASNSVDGAGLPVLPAGARISLSVLSVGQTVPGSDLTVVIRL